MKSFKYTKEELEIELKAAREDLNHNQGEQETLQSIERGLKKYIQELELELEDFNINEIGHWD